MALNLSRYQIKCRVADNLQDYPLIPFEDVKVNMHRFVGCLPLDIVGKYFDVEASWNASETKGKIDCTNGFMPAINTG
jgi:hypothetical protein